ncbi:MAG TPA: fumarylacetoacetate hydrolase family protein [Chloroflexia bacterium]|nr:fumarylacetoacetate hydrolase family protein [Chloroflexia bacterium]
MKLVTYLPGGSSPDPQTAMYAPRQALGRGGVLVNEKVYDLQAVCEWANREGKLNGKALPATLSSLLEFVALSPEQRIALSALVTRLPDSGLEAHPLESLRLRAPLEVPPSVRDFYAFEQHVKTARSNRGLGMIPEWYEFPVFYFSNHRAIYGPGDLIPYPRKSAALDIELEIACVIGRAGRDIAAEEAADYIAGYTIMNDWSARDLQMQEMKLNMGPVKGKDFATSLGPWLVTPDELADLKTGEGASERYNMTMVARLNGKEMSRGNFKDIYFSVPQLIERASLNTWLVPGDVIGSGTVGTGCILEQGDKRERWLQAGDEIELEIERLGVLSNKVVTGRE